MPFFSSNKLQRPLSVFALIDKKFFCFFFTIEVDRQLETTSVTLSPECRLSARWLAIKQNGCIRPPFYRVPQAWLVLFVDGIGEHICTGCRFDPFNKGNVQVGQLGAINDIYEAVLVPFWLLPCRSRSVLSGSEKWLSYAMHVTAVNESIATSCVNSQ